MAKIGDSTSVQTTSRIDGGANSPTKPETPASAVTPTVSNNGGETSKLSDLNTNGVTTKNRLQSFDGTTPAPTPTEAFSKEATVTRTGGQVIIDAGAGDDRIGVSRDNKGNITVNINGETQTFSGRDRDNLVIRAGDGNDTIAVDANVTVNLRLEGGAGDDTVRGGGGHDKIEGGDGNDRINGGGGNDYVNGSLGDDRLSGDDGNDTVYGGDGADEIHGNAGDDYLEGSRGNDRIFGGDGGDVLSGGIGDDELNGNAGDDALYTGQGIDTANDDEGSNKVYAQTDDAVQESKGDVKNTVVTVELKGNPGGTGVVVKGSDEFRERVEADLEMLRSSPVGRQMLTSFDDAEKRDGVTVTIQELPNENNGYADWENRLDQTKPQPFMDPVTGQKGTPNSSTISYNPQFAPTFEFSDGTEAYTPPNTVLFHEMGHAYDYTHGTFRTETYNGTDANDRGINLRVGERVAVGLPIDHDSNPRTAERTDDANHPDELTENGLREEMNLQLRNSYALANLTKV